jgi:hypothetical protein
LAVGGDVGKDASEVGIDEPGDRMEDDVAIRLLLEGAIAGERMQVDIKSAVGAEPLHDGDDARVQRLDGGQAVLQLGAAANAPHDVTAEAAAHQAQRVGVVAQTHRERGVEGEHPLPVRNLGQQARDPVCRGLAHPPADARGTHGAALARKRNGKRVTAARTGKRYEAALEVAATEQTLQLVGDERRQRASVVLDALEERRQVLGDDADPVVPRGRSRDVADGAAGAHARRQCKRRRGSR